MVEHMNQRCRPPGYYSQVTLDPGSELNCNLLDHWMSHELSLDGLDLEHTEVNCKSTFLNAKSSSAVSIPENALANSAVNLSSPLQFELDFNSFYVQDSLSSFLQPNAEGRIATEENYEFKTFPTWGAPMDIDPLKLDEVFQVDTSDLAQSPTLAELNSYDEPFFDLEFGPHFSKNATVMQEPKNKKRLNSEENYQSTTTSHSKETIPQNDPNVFLTKVIKVESVEEAAAEDCAVRNQQEDMQTSFLSKPLKLEKMPLNVSSEEKASNSKQLTISKKKIQPPRAASKILRRHRHRSGVSTCSISSWSSLSHDDLETDEEDNDSEDQFSSENESEYHKYGISKSNTSSLSTASSATFSTMKSTKNNKTKRYFWQYNIQSKGPKVGSTTRIVLPHNILDPHVLDDARDPVFSPACNLEGVKHSGKARRGDGNDLTPCPRKLRNIGLELDALNRMINDLTPVSDVPFNARPRTRKEKNKLASRACRLKKKAQHEANKVKLYGLQKEHQMLNDVIKDVRRLLLTEVEAYINKNESKNLNKYQPKDLDFKEKIDKLMIKTDKLRVAGCSAEFVNSILEKVSMGHPTGGMEDL